jgi:hypothetical protein
LRQLSLEGDRSILGLKYELLGYDKSSQWDSDYESEIIPKAVAMQQEMVERLHEPAHRSPDSLGRTPWEKFEIAQDLSALASKLSDSDDATHVCR